MADEIEEGQEQVTFTDGTEGSTQGYLTPDQMESVKSEEKPDEEDDQVEEDDQDVDKDEEDDPDVDKTDSKDKTDKPDGLEARTKALEKQYTTKFRELSKKRGMIQMMERIQANPEEMIPWMAEKFGVPMGKKSTEKESDEVEFDAPNLSGMEPNKDESMPAYINRVFAEGMKGLITQIPKAIASGMKTSMPTQQGTRNAPPGGPLENDPIEKALKFLDKNHDDWPLYEDDMITVLKEKPELIEDPAALYKEGKQRSGVFEKRAKSKAKKVTKRFSTGMRGTGKRGTSKKGKIASFNDAWEQAKVDVNRR